VIPHLKAQADLKARIDQFIEQAYNPLNLSTSPKKLEGALALLSEARAHIWKPVEITPAQHVELVVLDECPVAPESRL
jgi:hypothetical protein